MATAVIYVEAPPDRCFEVLSDPRSFSYWVVGSRRIKAADPNWPQVGSAFDHAVGFGPVVTHDHTEVEEVVENRLLCLRAKARPFGTAYVRLELEPDGVGTRLRITEEPGDRITRAAFTAFADRVLRARNEESLRRLKGLAEGAVPMPAGGLPARDSDEARNAPPAHGRVGTQPGNRAGQLAGGFGRGVAAGLVGASAMSASTNIEMRASGRRPSDVPARTLQRLLALPAMNRAAAQRLTPIAHVLTAAAVGGTRGLLTATGLRAPYDAPVVFALAMTPELVVVPALGIVPPPWRWSPRDLGISVLHHGVFSLATAWTLAKLEH